jgi:hypothetical protein
LRASSWLLNGARACVMGMLKAREYKELEVKFGELKRAIEELTQEEEGRAHERRDAAYSSDDLRRTSLA